MLIIRTYSYQELPRIRPCGSIKPFDGNPSLVLQLSFINNVRRFLSMFRDDILHSKPRCSCLKLVNGIFTKWRQITCLTRPFFLLNKIKLSGKSEDSNKMGHAKRIYIPTTWDSATTPFFCVTQQHEQSLDNAQLIAKLSLSCKITN